MIRTLAKIALCLLAALALLTLLWALATLPGEPSSGTGTGDILRGRTEP